MAEEADLARRITNGQQRSVLNDTLVNVISKQSGCDGENGGGGNIVRRIFCQKSNCGNWRGIGH